MNLRTAHIFRTVVSIAILFVACTQAANARFYHLPTPIADTNRYPLYDRPGDPYSYRNRNTFDLRDTSYIKRSVEYDPKTKQYYIIEKIGTKYYRTPVAFSMEEFLKMQGQKDEEDYFRKRAALLANMNRRIFKPKLKATSDWFNRIVGAAPDGSVKIDIKPSGFVELLAGYQGQNIKNPTLPERAQKNGGFDFNMNSQLRVDGNIGDKLKIPISYNTLANFDFENQLKLDYQGKDDQILKQFQLGNVNFSTKSTLIPGAQSLFGIKSQLQFGKLFLTSVFANQRSTRQSAGLQGGASTQSFSIMADEYEENRHFLMSQYFHSKFDTAMSRLPIVNSVIQISKVEVWVTNRNGATTDTRDIVALMDLGEGKPFGPWGGTGNDQTLPENYTNNLYRTLTNNPNTRNSSLVQNILTGPGFNMSPIQDFEKTFARKLQESEYTFNSQIGFISLNQTLQPDEVLGIAFQYTYNGRVFQVGEFSQDVPPDTTGTTQRVLFLKLLKATSQRTNLPIWELMMKNIYSVGYGQLERQDFQLNVVYEEPSLGQKNYLPPTDVISTYQGKPLISLLRLDRLNNQNDPQPDGIFDFVENFTIVSNQSRVIFPVLEPFGHALDYVYATQALRDKYLYYPLYDTIKAIAQTYANLDRFKLVGRSKTTAVGDYQLGYNIPRGSVTVTAGGQTLQENIDYEINYDLGTLRVTNQSIINSGIPVNIQYENQASFGLQQKSFMGVRIDYLANKNFTLGATMVQLSERPYFIKQSYGEDPIRNRMYGIDFDYRNNIPRLTKWLDKLPFYSTRVMSSISAYGEGAILDPGHAKQIGKGDAGVIYADDFEGTRAGIDLRFPLISWTLASIPQKNGLFPESALVNDLAAGYNRAKIAWYNIEPVLQERRNSDNPYKNNTAELSKPEVRQVLQSEIFPNKSVELGQGLLTTFDIAFYPREKGPYNFEFNNGRIDDKGNLLNPKQAWGGLMRNIDQTDFETSNIEYIEFWLQDPFINHPNSQGGQLYFDLGNISEDILRDGKRMYENGLRKPSINAPVDNNTVWGKVPANPLQVTNAFSNDPDERQYQDVGFDGLRDDEEKTKFSNYVTSLGSIFGTSSPVYLKAQTDPSLDNFVAYRDDKYENSTVGILERYKQINNPQGNSPLSTDNSKYVNAFTQYPDAEELNRDNTMNEAEEYFEYRVDLSPTMSPLTNSYITDVRSPIINLPNETTRTEKWYLFRIPVSDFTNKIGNIPDFKSIRFIRMYMTNFADTQVVLRFGKLELVRNQWRKFRFQIDTTGRYTNLPVPDPTEFNTLAVNVEENDQRQPINYRIPPGIERQQQLSNNNVSLFLNEQSLSLQICNLQKKESRGVFKTMNLDLRQYGRLQMFIHAENRGSGTLDDNELSAVVRLGNDFQGNYYEIKIPLKKTNFGATDSLAIWPLANNLDFDLSRLIQLKTTRNKLGISPSVYYFQTEADGRTYAMIGNPNLGEVKGFLLAIKNEVKETACTEVWFNELRFSHLDESGGKAGLVRVDLKLADLGSITVAGTYRSSGFGTLEQRVNERSREDVYTFDVSASIEAGKLLPKKLGVQIPVYAGISRSVSTPEYDPYDLDIKFKDKIKDVADKKTYREDAQDVTTIKTVNLTNVRKLKTDGKKPKIWSVSNFDFNYSYIETKRHNPLIENDDLKRTRGALGYMYAPQVRPFEPFKNLIKSKSRWLALIRDFNFRYVPSQLSVKADVFRQFGVTQLRNVGGGPFKSPETYNKYFTFDRYYNLNWNLTQSITIDYNALNNARIDEPYGRIDTRDKKDSVRKNFFKGGRNTNFHQEVNITYEVPMKKIPLLDWTTLRASYNAKYNWQAASLLATELGNILSNTQTRTINGELKFESLYLKSRLLRAAYAAPLPPSPDNNNPANPKDNKKGAKKGDLNNKGNAANPDDKNKSNNPALIVGDNKATGAVGTDSTGKKKKVKTPRVKKDPNQLPEISAVPKFLLKLVTSLKHVGVTYTEDFGTMLPGYMDSTKILGQNFKSGEPGFRYIFGYQPDTNWINRFGAKGLLSMDTLVSSMIQQRYNQRLNITAQVIPFNDFIIDLNLEKTFDKQYSELYKDTSKFDNVGLTRLNPYAMGSFNVSYISYKTLFTKFDPNVISETFEKFQSYRILLSKKLGTQNPYQPGLPGGGGVGADGFYKGYGKYAQDVVIPSFIAAYTGKDPNKVKLTRHSNPNLRSNPFSGIIPKPNWMINYAGLSKLKGLDKIFTNVIIRHGYHSTLSMNSFNTALLFTDPNRVGYPKFVDTLTGNFIPYFLIPNITIQEAFDPLIGIDVTFSNSLTIRAEYKKSRQLSLSLIDYQLAENRSTEFTFGFNWTKRGMPLIKRFFKMKLDNIVTFRCDFSIRDDATANTKLDQKTAFGTAGQKVIHIAPSIDYTVNSRVRIKMYFEQTRNIPKISNSFPVTNTRAGLQVTISLAD